MNLKDDSEIPELAVTKRLNNTHITPTDMRETSARAVCYLGRRVFFVSRTPAPPPFSAINSTPASWRAATRDSPVSARPPMSPSAASSLLTVGADTPECLAKSSWDHPRTSAKQMVIGAEPPVGARRRKPSLHRRDYPPGLSYRGGRSSAGK